MDIPDSDAAYALVSGLSRAEQQRLLNALLDDMEEELLERTLSAAGWVQGNSQ
jgi:hypothetical protein